MTASLLSPVWRHCVRWLLLCLCLPGLVWAQASAPGSSVPLAVPALRARVMDLASALSPDQRASLETKLSAFEQEHGTQIVVLLVDTTQPEDIAAFAFRVADRWKIGRREVGDGLLLVVALKDHRSRIEVARALEGAIPDVLAGRILVETLAPALPTGDVAGGLDQTVGRLMGLVQSGGVQAAPADPGAARPGTPSDATPSAAGHAADLNLPWWLWPALVAVLLGMVVIRAWIGPFPGALLMGGVTGVGGALFGGLQLGLVVGGGIALVTLIGLGNVLMAVISSGLGGGSGGGSGGGGGFSSGGGGSFGGGGASGSW